MVREIDSFVNYMSIITVIMGEGIGLILTQKKKKKEVIGLALRIRATTA